MLIRVKVFPGSKKKEIIKKSDGRFEVKVKAKPERGMANEAVIDALSSYFGVSASKIKLIKGSREKNKMFKIID